MDKEEFEKCKQNPRYWYNTYLLKEGEPKLSQEEWDERIKFIKEQRNLMSRERWVYEQYPLRPDQCFKK